MRILIGTTEISGLAADLCKCLRQAGQDAQLVLRSPHRFAYSVEEPNTLVRVWHRLHQTAGMGFLRRGFARVARFLWGLLVLVWAVRRFDTFLYLFGVGITDSPYEFRFLRLLGKRVIVFYVGSDERPPFMDGAVCLSESPPTLDGLRKMTRSKKRRIIASERYASLCIGSPFSGQFHERSFINCFALGIPRHFEITNPSNSVATPRSSVRILHAPSQSAAKGSKFIEDIIQNLLSKGLPIEYVRLENATNDQVLREIDQCDFIVDQLYSDTPMSAFPTEAAYLGKPSVVGGYLAEDLSQFLSASDIPPTLFVLPEQLQCAIERLVNDEGYRTELGKQAQKFVRERWSSREVARRYMLLFQDDIPADWWVEPSLISYCHGFGMPNSKLSQLIDALRQRHGRESLCLTDKPLLEARLFAMVDKTRGDAGALSSSA